MSILLKCQEIKMPNGSQPPLPGTDIHTVYILFATGQVYFNAFISVRCFNQCQTRSIYNQSWWSGERFAPSICAKYCLPTWASHSRILHFIKRKKANFLAPWWPGALLRNRLEIWANIRESTTFSTEPAEENEYFRNVVQEGPNKDIKITTCRMSVNITFRTQLHVSA